MDKIREGRISQEVKKALSNAIFFELNDPNIAPVLTISEVKVSKDLSYADVFLSIMGTEWEKGQTMDSMEKAKGFLRSYVASQVDLRQVPELRFHLDRSIEHGMYMDKLISETLAKDREAQRQRGEEIEDKAADDDE